MRERCRGTLHSQCMCCVVPVFMFVFIFACNKETQVQIVMMDI